MTQPLVRVYQWPVIYESFAKQRSAMPFKWGSNDCSTFCADFVLAITGQFIVPEKFIGHSTAKSALRALKDSGGLPGIVSSVLGQPRPVLLAQIGDVVLVKIGRHDALGICNGDTVIGPGKTGIVAVGLADCQLCWRVGGG
jgi:hypothetical protein